MSMKNILLYILIIIILFVSIMLGSKSCTPYSPDFNRGYGSRKDDVETLLNRTEWANNYKGRLYFVFRHIFYSIVITFIILCMVYNTLPPPMIFLQCAFVNFILLHAFHNYIQYHCEKFSHYAIDRNLKIVRQKLGMSYSTPPKTNYTFSYGSSCRKYNYRNL